jgi:hypothetical protein
MQEGRLIRNDSTRFLRALSSAMRTRVATACNASGTLTANAADLCKLTVVECTGDQLIGLNLAGQEFGGSIPEFDTSPPRLTQFDVSANVLSGTLPTSIGRLSRLEFLRVDGNRLRGAIPIQLLNLTRPAVGLRADIGSLVARRT